MLCKRHCQCSPRNRKINIVLGGREENVPKMLKNQILLPSVSTLLSPIVVLVFLVVPVVQEFVVVLVALVVYVILVV